LTFAYFTSTLLLGRDTEDGDQNEMETVLGETETSIEKTWLVYSFADY